MTKKITIDETLYNLHEYCLDINSRQMWLHGIQGNMHDEEGEPGVEYQMATQAIKNLNVLMMSSPDEEILVHLHSCGGDFDEGMAIYDNIKAMPFIVKMLNHTHARSMSSIIFQAADDRVMMPNSTFMFHYGSMGFEADTKTFLSTADFAKVANRVMVDIYVEKCKYGAKFEGWKEKKIRKHLIDMMDKKGDVYLTAKETLEWGLADRIVETYGEL